MLGPTALEAPAGADVVRVTTARGDGRGDLGASAAAPRSRSPPRRSPTGGRPTTHASKVKKTRRARSRWRSSATRDILAALGARKNGTFLVGFAAETEDHEANAREKLTRKQLDAIAVNDVAGGRGFGPGENALVVLWGTDGRRELGRASEALLAARLVGRDARDPRKPQLTCCSRSTSATPRPSSARSTTPARWPGRGASRPRARRTADEYGILFSAFFSSAQLRHPRGRRDRRSARSSRSSIGRWSRAARNTSACARPAFTAATQTIIPVRTDRPAEVGADLVAAAIAARELVGAPSIAINFGTATTYGAIDRRRRATSASRSRPGLQVSLDALVGRTGEAAAGRAASAGARRSAAKRFRRCRAGSSTARSAPPRRSWRASAPRSAREARVIASGGLAAVIGGETPVIERVEPHLVLYGLHAHYRSL